MPNVEYLLNDPVAPFTLQVPLPATPEDLKIAVTSYADPPVKAGTVQAQALNAYITVAQTINSRQKAISRSRPKLSSWAATSKLIVAPRAGKDLNAYYDRRGLKFFYYPIGNSIIYLVDSTDVVAHELGHALLDAMRPDFWSVQALEIWSFHEAFADITAILAMMEYPVVLEAAIKETNKDLRKSNCISRLAEQVGNVLFGRRHLYLRDAVNTFKYQNPTTLPAEGPDEQLQSERHSFGRVFLGAWWEFMVGIYEQECKRLAPKDALVIAKNVAADYMYKAIVQSPLTAKYHYAIARGMLVADKANEDKYAPILNAVLKNRNLMPPEIKTLANLKKKDLDLGENDLVVKRGKTTAVVVKGKKVIKLMDHHPAKAIKALALDEYNLAEVKLEVPFDTYYEFDEKGILQHQFVPEEDEVIEVARLCAMSIANQENVGKNKMWKISRNKLVRSFVE